MATTAEWQKQESAEDGTGTEDEFGGFGDDFDDSEADFGDFAEAPAIAAVDKEGQRVTSIESVLAHTSSLFAATKDHEDCAETMRNCLARALHNCEELLASTSAVPDVHSALLASCKMDKCIESLVATPNPPPVAELEPRLLQNVLAIALSSTKLSDDLRVRLLTPLAELSVKEVRHEDEVTTAVAP
ncbi:hypothetical protein IWW38_005765, partial [Coemansia aciculifera]